MSAGLSGMAEGSAEFFYRAHFRAQRGRVQRQMQYYEK